MAENKSLTYDGRIRSVKFALRGIRTMVASQHNAWIHAAATVAVVAGCRGADQRGRADEKLKTRNFRPVRNLRLTSKVPPG